MHAAIREDHTVDTIDQELSQDTTPSLIIDPNDLDVPTFLREKHKQGK